MEWNSSWRCDGWEGGSVEGKGLATGGAEEERRGGKGGTDTRKELNSYLFVCLIMLPTISYDIVYERDM